MIWVCMTGIVWGRSPLEQSESLTFQCSHYRKKTKREVKILTTTTLALHKNAAVGEQL